MRRLAYLRPNGKRHKRQEELVQVSQSKSQQEDCVTNPSHFKRVDAEIEMRMTRGPTISQRNEGKRWRGTELYKTVQTLTS